MKRKLDKSEITMLWSALENSMMSLLKTIDENAAEGYDQTRNYEYYHKMQELQNAINKAKTITITVDNID